MSPAPRNRRSLAPAVVALGILLGATCIRAAAQSPPQSLPQSPPQSLPQSPPASAPAFSAVQLDQMLAPIALYPDGLLAQILMAATYPLEIVEADRWLQNPDNAALRGAALVQALQPLPWDTSVKSLVAFPQVLEVLDSNLDWTEQLGEAFMAQQRDVMDHVQRLRGRAEAARTLVSNPQQRVIDNGPDIEIAPYGSDNVYVPVYDPDRAYGYWTNPDAAPYAFDMGGYFPGAFVGFVIIPALWGWCQWDWHNHGLAILGGTGAGGGARKPPRPVPWRHNPEHRDGVRYANSALQARYGGTAAGQAQAPQVHAYPVGRAPALPATLPVSRPVARALAAPPETAPAAHERSPVVAHLVEPVPAAAPSQQPAPAGPERRAREASAHAHEEHTSEGREPAPAGSGRERR